MNINLIVAIAANRAIGKNNQLLWHLPADLKHFKQLTSGHAIIMGRKTYDSIGRPLPNRRNIVISRSAMHIEGCDVASSIDAALALCADENEVFIIGGAEIYQQTLPLARRIYLTTVHQKFEGDTYFPEIKMQEWDEVNHENHQPDEKNTYAYTFTTLERR